jgi:hypothetical protein
MAASAAAVATAKTGVPAPETAASMPASTTMAPAAMLRPQGYSQKERERRDEHQAAHIASIIGRFWPAPNNL